MNTPTYSPGELVRIELLRYDNPDGLHPIEQQWRELARKLLIHVETLQEAIESSRNKDFRYSALSDFQSMKFPGKFTTTLPASQS